jgi:hypothetical protein
MMMFAFPIFGIFFLLFCFGILGRVLFRRMRGDRQAQRLGADMKGEKQGSFPFTRSKASGVSDLQAKVFRLAVQRGGRLTLSDIVVEMGLGLDEAEKLMDRMMDGIRVRLEVNEKGTMFYEFPEIMSQIPRDEP